MRYSIYNYIIPNHILAPAYIRKHLCPRELLGTVLLGIPVLLGATRFLRAFLLETHWVPGGVVTLGFW